MSHRTLAVGTAKGLFIYESSSGGGWSLREPALAGWEVTTLLLEPRLAAPSRILAATLHYAYGPTIRESVDGGATWAQLDARPAYAEGSPFKTTRIWQLVAAHPDRPGLLYAGVDEAGLFVSRDDAASWTEVTALTQMPSRKNWSPGAGGLCLHTILVDHADPDRMWVAISAVGVFRSTDGGASWSQATDGIAPMGNAVPPDPCPCYCVHRVVQHPSKPDALFMQFHGGVYRSRDGADAWQRIEAGLPGNFGFPIAVTRRGTLLIAPLHSDEQRVFPAGRFAIYRSADEGTSWHATTSGLPEEPTFAGVLRDAMACDGDSVYFGTTMGQVFASADDGQTWSRLPGTLPRVLSVRAVSY